MRRDPVEQLSPMLAADLRALFHIGRSECRLTARVKSKRTGLCLERTDNFPHLRHKFLASGGR